MQHAINKDYLFDKHFSQHMRLNGLIPKGIVGGARNEKYFDYSPDLSRALLKKAKVKTPLKVEFWVRRQDWNEGFINDIADQLAQIGIHIVIKHEDDKSFYATYFSRQQPIFLIPLSGVYPEASNYLGVFRSDSTDNDVLLADKKIDSSLEELSDMSDRNKLENAVYNIEDRSLQSAAIIPLYQRRAISVYQPWLVGVDMSFLWYNNFKINNYVKKSEKRS